MMINDLILSPHPLLPPHLYSHITIFTFVNRAKKDLATFEGNDSKVNQLVAAANSHDNLCRMDPAWHPWL